MILAVPLETPRDAAVLPEEIAGFDEGLVSVV
jgi:hypothetical protein